MLERFEKSIGAILGNIHEASQNPYVDVAKWLPIQEKIIKGIVYVEGRIRDNKSKIKALQFLRKNPSNRIPKDESKDLKFRLKYLENQIDEYHFVLNTYRSLGDAIAFTFIDKYDIKPLNFKESAGFISQKKGFTNEKKMMRYALKKGGMAILNDITSVLKYGDIMLVREDVPPISIEMKSSSFVNSRIKRQSDNANKIFKYLREDSTDELYNTKGNFKRVALTRPEKTYVGEVQALIEKALKSGYASKKMEDGLIYFVEYGDGDLDRITSKLDEFSAPIPFFLNGSKFLGQAYYPFSLSLGKHYLDFLCGRLVIFIVADFEEMARITSEFNYNLQILDDDGYCFSFTPQDNTAELISFKISRHFFQRVFMEFLSLRGILHESVQRF